MQIDLLPNLPPSGGYENIITAMDVFSRYLFAYPVTDASATNTAKVIIDIMTKHTYLPSTLITAKGTAFTSKLVAEIAQILGIQMNCATIKHPQTIGKLERTHASLKTNLKMASGDYRRQWHKYLPLAVLNYKTTYPPWDVNHLEFFTDGSHIIYWITNWALILTPRSYRLQILPTNFSAAHRY